MGGGNLDQLTHWLIESLIHCTSREVEESRSQEAEIQEVDELKLACHSKRRISAVVLVSCQLWGFFAAMRMAPLLSGRRGRGGECQRHGGINHPPDPSLRRRGIIFMHGGEPKDREAFAQNDRLLDFSTSRLLDFPTSFRGMNEGNRRMGAGHCQGAWRHLC